MAEKAKKVPTEYARKISVTLAPVAMEKLEEMSKRKGLNRSAVLALAVEKLWKEEYGAR